MTDFFSLPDIAIPLFALYAETHFRFFNISPSLLFRRMPEILFDMPGRLSPGRDLPIFLLTHDINRYHVELLRVQITLSQHNKTTVILDTTALSDYRTEHPYSSRNPAYIFLIQSDIIEPGQFTVNCRCDISRKSKPYSILNNNTPFSSKKPLSGFKGSEPLPGSTDTWYGDAHTHSHATESHVEWAAPLAVLDEAASSLGLDFTIITDHSYDLATSPENYLVTDPEHRRWDLLDDEISSGNCKSKHFRGEEVSALNYRGEIIHLGVVNNREFIRGDGDGARFSSSALSLSIKDACKKAWESGGIVFAAHPGSHPGLLERLFLGRGAWNIQDLNFEKFIFQGLNGSFDTDWSDAKKLWISALSRGKRVSLLAGNDAHGDFNRYTTMLPFLTVSEDDFRWFGKCRTGVYRSNERTILEQIENGSTFITDGPFIDIRNVNGTSVISNRPIEPQPLYLVVKTSSEYGKINDIAVYGGKKKSGKEELILRKRPEENEISQTIEIQSEMNYYSYIRAEMKTGTPHFIHRAVTSPLYVLIPQI